MDYQGQDKSRQNVPNYIHHAPWTKVEPNASAKKQETPGPYRFRGLMW